MQSWEDMFSVWFNRSIEHVSKINEMVEMKEVLQKMMRGKSILIHYLKTKPVPQNRC